MSTSTSEFSTLVRIARKDEYQKIALFACRAFIHDPVFNFFGSVRELMDPNVDTRARQDLLTFIVFLINACQVIGGRITVVVVNSQPGSGSESMSKSERIVSAALWYPPNKRLAVWKVFTLVQSGVFSTLRRWGLTGLMRIAFEYMDSSHAAMKKVYKANGIDKSSDASWYLQLIMTDPDFENQGMMSLLVREAFSHSPSTNFTLEATTIKSKDRYTHLGFDFVAPIKLGKGKVTSLGLPATGPEAIGVEYYVMVKVASKQ